MPNHIQNRLKVTGQPEDIKKVFATIAGQYEKGEKMQIDFNKIIPMPKGMDGGVNENVKMWAKICTGQINFAGLFKELPGSPSDLFKAGDYGTLADRLGASNAMEHLTGRRKETVKDLSEDDFNAFVQCLKNLREHGHTSWYEWSLQNWGTKWNAYQQNDKRNTKDTIYFQTAWSAPLPVILVLSTQFPDVEFELTYADEDSGSNTGIFTFSAGEILSQERPESQSVAGYNVYFELHPGTKGDYKLVGDTYQYIDEEE